MVRTSNSHCLKKLSEVTVKVRIQKNLGFLKKPIQLGFLGFIAFWTLLGF